jgi:hypothetical protein
MSGVEINAKTRRRKDAEDHGREDKKFSFSVTSVAKNKKPDHQG